MKKLLVVTMLTLFCGGFTALFAEEMRINTIPAFSAQIDNWFGINYNYDNYLTGDVQVGMVTKSYKAMFTFDTSVIPAGAVIDYVFLPADIVQLNAGGISTEELIQYFLNYYKADIAPLGGFGGSYYITAYDYYALPACSSVLESYGFMLFTQGCYNYINRYGYTQIRVGFSQNPEHISMELDPWDAQQLLIRYHFE